MKKTKITVLYNQVESLPFADPKAILTEQGARDDARTIARALNKAGYHSDVMELSIKTVKELRRKKADLFFNLCDGVGSIPKSEHKVPELLDRLELPYTGADASSLLLTTNKALTKRIFEQNNIPTPPYSLFEAPPVKIPQNLAFPLIVKPMAEDCSLGIKTSSVVFNLFELRREVGRIVNHYHEPALVEKYIRGRELNVTVIGNGKGVAVLPISEIKFGRSYVGSDRPKIVDFSAKWVEHSQAYKDTVGVCPARLSKKILQKVERLAIQAYIVCGGRDYARVDIRLARDGTPYFLEVNLNNDLSIGMGAARSAQASGMDYKDFIGTIADIASQRYRHA